MTAVTVGLIGIPNAGAGGEGRPGVTRTEIRVGGVATVSGAEGRDYAAAFDGVEAFFDEVNRRGGVFDRTLELVRRIDDGGVPSRNVAANRRLAKREEVFAVLPQATETFLGADQLVAAGTPTFGWNLGPEWARGPNLFGDRGSYRCFTCPAVEPAFVARQVGAQRVAVLAPEPDRGVDCGRGYREGLARYGLAVVVPNTNLDPALTRLDEHVQAMHAAGVDLVATCGLDFDAVRRVARAMRSTDLDAKLYAEGAYDPKGAKRARKLLEGTIVGVEFVPWEAPRSSPGTKAFLAAMKRRGQEPTEAAQAGWIGAQLLVDGIEAAGRSFTQQSVIEAINAMTDFRADGILPGISWAEGGHGPGREACTAFVEVVRGRYRLRFAEAAAPFVCFPENPVPPSLDAPTHRPAATARG